MAVPHIVFIDTSVFRAAQFNFRGRQFRALLDAAPAGTKLKLLVPAPTEGEIQRHMEASATEAVHALRKIKRDHAILHRGLKLPSTPNEDDDFERGLKIKLQQAWTEFKTRFDAKKLDYSGVDLREIMDWYFRQKAPFGSGDKRKEFPDALAFVAVRDHAAAAKAPVAVISRDKDLRDACEDESGLFPFSEVSDFTNLLLKEKERFSEATHLVVELRSAIITKIEEAFPDLAFDHERDPNGKGSVENVKVVGINIPDDGLVIIGLGQRHVDVEFAGTLEYSADVNYDDPDSWISGDPGDDVFYLHTCEGEVTDETDISGTIRISVSEDWKSGSLRAVLLDQNRIEVTTEVPQKDDYEPDELHPDEPGKRG